ncbi:ABC transporter permease [Cohnella lupini]|uniref:ABC-2 type transport system permease protein n=1 Tax=Cohnella lupini TaxID=1294267 RepID=A0A3D9IXM6_9BACL|nr:ABC transporter permease [Cohnella lupini]RED65856.1 ABC-2 type transport system permease protein [Cohnella lupini]
MRIQALAFRIVRQFIKDKRTLALMLLAPLLVLTLMKFVFDGQAVDPRIGAVKLPSPVIESLQKNGAVVIPYEDERTAMDRMAEAELDAVLSLKGLQPHITLEGSNPSKIRSVMEVAQKALQQLTGISGIQPALSYLHGSGDRDIFDYYGSVLVGFFSFFFVFLIAGVSFLRERTTGTLQRLLATPLRRWEIVAGYLLGFGLFTLLQATLIAWYSTSVLGIALEGSFLLVLFMNLLLALAALTLGTLLSAYAQNEFQMFQFIPLIVVPQIFFCGLIDLQSMPDWLQAVGKALPLYYGADALRGIMLRGDGWREIWIDSGALLGFAVLFASLNVLALRKHRRI